MDRDLSHLVDIRNACQTILSLTADLDEQAFFSTTEKYLAVLHQLIVMGEAAKRVSTATREREPHIPWKRIAGTRDKLVHEYDTVDNGIVWEIVQQDIPDLHNAILAAVEHHREGQS